MGFFDRLLHGGESRNARPPQPPDERAEEGRLSYGAQRFGAALESYGEAIDKLHTMYVMADPSSRHREPSTADQPILDGFVSSLGAALASQQRSNATGEVHRATHQLTEIVQIIERERGDASRYRNAIDEIAIAASG